MKEEIKKAILELFEKNSDYTFSELVSELENQGLQATGDRALYLKKNLIIWENTSADFNNAIAELEQADKLELKRLGKNEALLVSVYGSTLLDLPIADRLENYSAPHWVPTIIKRK